MNELLDYFKNTVSISPEIEHKLYEIIEERNLIKGEQILTLEHDEEAISPNNFTVAAILIAHYDCSTGIREENAIELEMHSIRDGSGVYEDADFRFEQWKPSDLESMMNTLRLFVGSTNGLGNVNNHYAKYHNHS